MIYYISSNLEIRLEIDGFFLCKKRRDYYVVIFYTGDDYVVGGCRTIL